MVGMYYCISIGAIAFLQHESYGFTWHEKLHAPFDLQVEGL
jgi:hypothetical protein